MNDARLLGFTAHRPGADDGLHRMLHHIARGTTISPYVSLTRSYGVACAYALAGRSLPSIDHPAYVYEIEIDSRTRGAKLIDPIKELARKLPKPTDNMTYHHDGSPDFLLGVVSPVRHRNLLEEPVLQPAAGFATPRPAMLRIELETLVRALRDAEILAFGLIPAKQVKNRFEVF